MVCSRGRLISCRLRKDRYCSSGEDFVLDFFFSPLRDRVGLCKTHNSLFICALLGWPHFWLWEPLYFVDVSDIEWVKIVYLVCRVFYYKAVLQTCVVLGLFVFALV